MTKHLIPVDGVFVHHAPAVEQDVDDETAAELLGWSPAPFTVGEAKAPKPKRVRKPKAQPTPAEPAEEQ